jgi:methyl-accepting chemotaxis protein
MSSRSQDSAKLTELAQQLHAIAEGSVKLVAVVEEINTSLLALTSQVNDIEEEIERLNRG